MEDTDMSLLCLLLQCVEQRREGIKTRAYTIYGVGIEDARETGTSGLSNDPNQP